ncbi:hypothetical protein ZIOFF_028311 [Zingiber officinale]|uniref:Uncharacterized protein n=1 Tax=Zingiber officinale TaxID=94328 RepID=A0A8J5GL46_ZINOF|nr:hypothetical protein ZIOFF_028311 [Zingiber officinale]
MIYKWFTWEKDWLPAKLLEREKKALRTGKNGVGIREGRLWVELEEKTWWHSV